MNAYLAFSWMNSRRASTSSPIRTLNSRSAVGGVLEGDLRAVRVSGFIVGLPQLLGVHLAEALEPLDVSSFLLPFVPAERVQLLLGRRSSACLPSIFTRYSGGCAT